MSNPDQALSACGCCEGVTALTPASVQNLAGRPTLAYRVGTHGSFKATMQAALALQPALANLTTRKDDDPSIALLDAWAMVLDVLTFYQERIANEGYLRTATEQRSVLELARAIGYELNPGVAASTFLAFTLDETEGSPTSVMIEVGTKAQSIPGQDELPQIFETIEALETRVEWNQLEPQKTQLLLPQFGDTLIYLKGTSTNLKAGDALLLVGDERKDDPANDKWDVRRLKTVTTVQPSEPTTDPTAGHTIVGLDYGLGSFAPFTEPAQVNPRVYALRQRAAIFGYNALDWRMLSDETKASYLGLGDPTQLTDEDRKEWPDFKILSPIFPQPETPTLSTDTVDLDLVYPQIIKGGWLVLSVPNYKELYEITEVTEGARAGFGLSGKTTRVTLRGENLAEQFENEVRTTTAFGQNEELAIAETPIATAVSGISVTLDQEVEGLAEGRLLALRGLDETTGNPISEVILLDRAESDGQRTTLYFITPLQHGYQRDSVKINANVVRATHGETKTEILGSGDGSRVFAKFVLKQTPLTYVSAATPSGSQTTLEIRANQILWEEVFSLYGQGPTDRVYITRLSDNGAVTVETGDGITGARLPTGTENVTATYRVGTGLEGLVEADQISLLMTRPLGLKAVTNPVASTGAADPEALDRARQNAPLTVLTMERIVSLKDFEDFTSAFAGIGKAQATLLWNGERQMVHISVAGVDGAGVDPTSELYQNLRAAIDAARHVDQAVQVDSYQPLSFSLSAKVLVDEQYIAMNVMVAVAAALQEAYSFERRSFGQAVTKSEVLAVMQGVEGVVAVDLDALYLNGEAHALNTSLPARRAYWDQGVTRPAELLTVHPDGIVLTELN